MSLFPSFTSMASTDKDADVSASTGTGTAAADTSLDSTSSAFNSTLNTTLKSALSCGAVGVAPPQIGMDGTGPAVNNSFSLTTARSMPSEQYAPSAGAGVTFSAQPPLTPTHHHPAVQKRDDSPMYHGTNLRTTVRLEPQGLDPVGLAGGAGASSAPLGMAGAPPEQSNALYNKAATSSYSYEQTEDPTTAISTIEVDYDRSPTDLYSLVEKRQWESVQSLLTTLPPTELLRQASTWMVRKEKDGKLRWRLLPLHGAVIFRGPLSVVTGLVAAYPGAARCKDDQGMLPLHLAFRNDAPDDIINEVLSANPAAVTVQDRKGRTPLRCALSGNNCSKKSRARLLERYTIHAIAAEKETLTQGMDEHQRRAIKDVEDRYSEAMIALRATCDARLVESVAIKKEKDDALAREEALRKELEVANVAKNDLTTEVKDRIAEEINDGMAREDALRKELEASQGREAELAEKVQNLIKIEINETKAREEKSRSELETVSAREADLTVKVEDLTKALQAMTSMRRAETQRFNEESTQWSRVSQDLVQKMSAVQTERDSVAEEVEMIREEKDRASVQKDVLRTSIDELVLSHRGLQAERDELEGRNAELTRLMERNLTEQEGMHAMFNKLDQDMGAAATVRERMIASINKQEADVTALAAREHDVMRGILVRQREEMETCLRNDEMRKNHSSQQQQQQQQQVNLTHSAEAFGVGNGMGMGMRRSQSSERMHRSSVVPPPPSPRSSSTMLPLGLAGAPPSPGYNSGYGALKTNLSFHR